MKEDTTITPLHQPGTFLDPLTEIAREGARQMLAAALRAEAASFVASFTDERLPDGRQRVVHHGTGPARMIQTGIGPIPVERQKVRDRATDVPAEKKVRFISNTLLCEHEGLTQDLFQTFLIYVASSPRPAHARWTR